MNQNYHTSLAWTSRAEYTHPHFFQKMRAGKMGSITFVVMFSLLWDQLCDENFYSFIISGKFASRLTLDANNNISILDKSCGVENGISELNLAVENKFCGLHKSHSFALNKDITFKSNLVAENDICRLEIRKSCDISFEIDTFRLKSRRSALENDSKMARRMYKRGREPSRIRKCQVMQKRSKRKYLNLYCFDLSK